MKYTALLPQPVRCTTRTRRRRSTSSSMASHCPGRKPAEALPVSSRSRCSAVVRVRVPLVTRARVWGGCDSVLLSAWPYLDPRQTGEPAGLVRDDQPTPSGGRGGDEQIVGATRPPRPPDMSQEDGMVPGNGEVVRLDGDRGQHRFDERSASGTAATVSQLGAHK